MDTQIILANLGLLTFLFLAAHLRLLNAGNWLFLSLFVDFCGSFPIITISLNSIGMSDEVSDTF